MRTTYQAQANQFAKAVSSPSLQPFARDFRLPARLCKLIQQFFDRFIICIQNDVVHFVALLIGRHTSFSFCLIYSFSSMLCFVWCSHFQDVISTETLCMLCGCRLSRMPWTEHRLEEVIQPQPCKRQNKYFVCRLFLIFGCLFLPCIIWRPACHMEYSRALQSASRPVCYATSCAT